MINIELLEYESNKPLGETNKCDVVPRVGEYFILDEDIKEDWKKKFYIVRAVTHTLSGSIIVHIEYHDVDKAKEAQEKWEELRNKVMKTARGVAGHGIQEKSNTEVE